MPSLRYHWGPVDGSPASGSSGVSGVWGNGHLQIAAGNIFGGKGNLRKGKGKGTASTLQAQYFAQSTCFYLSWEVSIQRYLYVFVVISDLLALSSVGVFVRVHLFICAFFFVRSIAHMT
jgi:hypothetical protein|mmetsp:Transcript_13868/g.25262  ORF Transcript_13868/g.25262 Transcript_13868/m.25262 type:complete len:119 (+) Transcript_13868:3105-3461(+)